MRACSTILEKGAVRQSRQIVVERLPHEPLLEHSALRDIGQRAGHPGEASGVVVDRPDVGLDPDVAPVAPDQPKLMSEFRHVARGDGAEEVGVEVTVLGVDEGDHRSAHRADHAVTGELLPRVVEQRPAAFAVHAEDDFANALDDLPVTRLAVPQGFARGALVGDRLAQPAAVPVQHECDEADHRAERGDAQHRGVLRWQIGARRSDLDDRGREYGDDPRRDERCLERATVEEGERERDGHDRHGRQGGDRRRNRGGDEDGGEHGGDEQVHGATGSAFHELLSGVDHGPGQDDHDERSRSRGCVPRLDHQGGAGEREDQRHDRQRDGQPSQLPDFRRGQLDLRRPWRRGGESRRRQR